MPAPCARAPSDLPRRPHRVRCFVGDALDRPRESSGPELKNQGTRSRRDPAAPQRTASCSTGASSSRSRNTGCTSRSCRSVARPSVRNVHDGRGRQRTCGGASLRSLRSTRPRCPRPRLDTAWQRRPRHARGAAPQAISAAKGERFSRRSHYRRHYQHNDTAHYSRPCHSDKVNGLGFHRGGLPERSPALCAS